MDLKDLVYLLYNCLMEIKASRVNALKVERTVYYDKQDL